MSTVSRTKRTIQNSTISLILYFIQIFVGFFSRKIFLEYLGDEVLGVNTMLGNILSFLNLAELGIGIAMATSLYKPLHDQDNETICEIISVQGYLYKYIAYLLCFLSIPVLIAIPFLFPHTECGLLYIYIAYIVFLWGTLASYIWNYRQILITADQKGFKLNPWKHALRYIKIFAQIFCLTYIHLGIWGWISLELFEGIFTIFVINYILKREYPWLQTSSKSGKQLLAKYRNLITMTKQLFIHKISSFVLEQTAPWIIYAYVSITMVTYYSNYMMLISYVVILMNAIFEGMGASIGNLISENNKTHTLDVFWELFTSRIWISGIACFALYVSIEPFISLWIGSRYILEDTTLLLLIIGMYIRLSRSVIDSFKLAYQLFGDIWAPIVEASINLGCSILFGYWWGLDGVILGSNLSLIIIVLIWKPYYTFTHGLHASWGKYYIQYVYHTIILILCAYCTLKIINSIYQQIENYYQIIIYTSTAILIYTLFTYTILLISTEGMRSFTYRIRHILIKLLHRHES